ncbi:MAG: response regulator [Proteobacteria bacterium]|nr:response regulator [Pseudomonadota bacterium]
MNPAASILVIEDNAGTRKKLRLTLQRENYQILEAEDGKSALKIMQTDKPDLILQDLSLPDMEAADLNKQLRDMPNGAKIPILGMSGFFFKNEELALNTGFTTLLLKPVDPAHLIEVISKHLNVNVSSFDHTLLGKYVLIADDNKSQRELLRLQLSRLGLNVSVAQDGQEALQLVQEIHPDALISDILMPKLDGYKLCLAIRKMPKFKALPIILKSAHYLEEADQKLARNVGASAYVMHTPSIQPLIDKLSECIKSAKSATIAEPLGIQGEHTARLMQQLERQILNAEKLARRCALLSSQLSLITSVTKNLAQGTSLDNTHLLNETLIESLDAVGISKAILYFLDSKHALSVKEMMGYSLSDKTMLDNFFGHKELFDDAFVNKYVVSIPFKKALSEKENDFLNKAGISAGLLIPLSYANKSIGILFFGTKMSTMLGPEQMVFLQVLGGQINQTVVLARSLKSLNESEVRYKSLMDNASCAIVVGKPNGEIIEINKQAELLFGLTKSNIQHEEIINFVVPQDQFYVKTMLNRISKDKVVGPSEIHIKKREDAQTRIVEVTGVLIEINNELFVYMMFIDVTERNQLRSKGILNEKLATADLIASKVADEINFPISWIMAKLESLKKQLSGIKIQSNEVTNEMLKEAIEETLEKTKKIDNLVKNLKGFTQTDDLEITSVSLHELINSAANIVMTEYNCKAELRRNFSANLPAFKTNSGKLHQVILNLLVNAAQAIPENEATQHITVSTSRQNGDIRISIEDSGRGISPTDLPKIFDPFFTTKSPGVGTGLGLYICYQTIKNLGGDIEVESQENKGTTFTVSLPVHKEL